MPIVDGKNTSRTMTDEGLLYVPQINMNGTTAEALKQEAYEAATAIRKAIKVVSAMTVHGRDWQTVADDAEYRAARLQQVDRLAKLAAVQAECEQIYLAIMAQEN